MNDNYPPGVTDAHPYFNPAECPECGAVMEGSDIDGYECPDEDCGYSWDPEDQWSGHPDV